MYTSAFVEDGNDGVITSWHFSRVYPKTLIWFLNRQRMLVDE